MHDVRSTQQLAKRAKPGARLGHEPLTKEKLFGRRTPVRPRGMQARPVEQRAKRTAIGNVERQRRVPRGIDTTHEPEHARQVARIARMNAYPGAAFNQDGPADANGPRPLFERARIVGCVTRPNDEPGPSSGRPWRGLEGRGPFTREDERGRDGIEHAMKPRAVEHEPP